MTNYLISGTGKMGQEVIRMIGESKDSMVICAFDKEAKQGFHFPTYNKIQDVKETPDVIVDFSKPEATFKILEYAKTTGTPIVIATTGFTEKELEYIKECSKDVAIFRSYNMSYKIALLKNMLQRYARFLDKDSDVEIIDYHHNRKIDSPSGTSIVLADAINEACDNEFVYNFDRMNTRKPRDKKEIGFASVRAGNIVGKHTVLFEGELESFEITHSSYSGSVFAKGALRAAEFIVNKKSGLYSMDDIFKDMEW